MRNTIAFAFRTCPTQQTQTCWFLANISPTRQKKKVCPNWIVNFDAETIDERRGIGIGVSGMTEVPGEGGVQ